jgi:uncharacterized membrane protein YdbT with pleckstrin-like domain
MSYTEASLQPGEIVTLQTTVSLWNAGWGLLLTLVTTPILGALSLIFVAIAIIDHYFTEYTVTNRRVMVKRGVIRRRVSEMSLGQVEGINLGQSVIGRILGHGNLGVRGTGGDSVVFSMVQDPVAFRTLVLNEVDNHKKLR